MRTVVGGDQFRAGMRELFELAVEELNVAFEGGVFVCVGGVATEGSAAADGGDGLGDGVGDAVEDLGGEVLDLRVWGETVWGASCVPCSSPSW